MKYLTKEQIEKLPKWAQKYIQTLEMRHQEVVQELESLLDQSHLRKGTTGKVRVKAYTRDKEQFLPDRTTIAFRTNPADPQTEISVYIDWREPEFLNIYSNFRSLAFMPIASNTGKIKVTR